MSKLSDYKETWRNCTKCALCTGTHIVFSDGPEDAEIMLIGESPGAKEDQAGIPFVGPAGMLMTKILALAGIQRQQCYWTNIVKHWPKINGKTRQPYKEEINTCLPLLLEEIRQVRPKVILLVGAIAAKALLGHEGAIKPIIGRWATVNNIPTLTTWHPAAILHTQDKDQDLTLAYKKDIWRDVKALRDTLTRIKKGAIPEIKNISPISFDEQLKMM